MAAAPVYLATPRTKAVTLTTASTSRTGASSVVIFDAPAGGSYCEKIRITSKGLNPAAVARVFWHDGTTKTLLKEIELAATTASETTAQFTGEASIKKGLKSTETIEITLSVAATDGWAVVSDGGDF
jgi:hypothetical protein